jgi:hypothetical protein
MCSSYNVLKSLCCCIMRTCLHIPDSLEAWGVGLSLVPKTWLGFPDSLDFRETQRHGAVSGVQNKSGVPR